jgi:hypothetical protein
MGRLVLDMDVDCDLFRGLAIIAGTLILIVYVIDLQSATITAAAPEGVDLRVMYIVFIASLLIVFIADHANKHIAASTVGAIGFVLTILIVVSLLTVFIADHMSGVLSDRADEVKAFVEILIAYILIYVGIKGLVSD